ncbi:PREDICTED: C-X-C chemokine receptor type 4-like [Rhagoletis zephyria]|uniref:C-X-C chemokine receptor type 4-like n=1 Tax=Rhagoletis zephyria TaxID=28612 RepID=UPI0008112239|nr:PREDICTED: C-X-C chemokine receptor type 4-like [Rhagoletis zephyria]
MNSDNMQQWWQNTFRHHHLQYAFNPQNLHALQLPQHSEKMDAARLNLLPQIGNNDFDDFNNNTWKSNSYDINCKEANSISSLTLLIMIISFGLVIFGGVLGNATLLLTLCSASKVRMRNPLLLAVCLADLLVTAISAPVTFLNVALNYKSNSLPLTICKIIHYVQVMPVAASTISFFMLSLDRYATVRHPSLAQLRKRRFLHVSVALLSWIASAALSTPFLFTYKIMARSATNLNDKSIKYPISSEVLAGASENVNMGQYFHIGTISPNVRINCIYDAGASTVLISFIIFHTFAVFIIPALGVLVNHYGVRQKLCALSLTARAAHGELPLPMPILRRQTHMLIVTGIANAQQAATDDNPNGPEIQLQNLNPRSDVERGLNYMNSTNPISPSRFVGKS